MAQAALQSVLTDITGASKLEYEDPRWAQLLHSRQILHLRGDEALLEGFALRLIENNLVTGNLMVLLNQTSSRIRQILEKRGTPTAQNLEQCCVSMHFTGLVLNILFSRLGTSDIKKQLSLTADWPSVRLSATDQDPEAPHSSLPTGDATTHQILQDVLEVLSVSSPPSWMHDVVFCAATLALSFCSTQLFQEDVRDDANNIFLSYLFAVSEVEVRNAVAPGSRYSIGSTMPVKLVKSILSHIIALQECTRGSVVHEMTKSRDSGAAAIKLVREEEEGYFARAIRKLLRFNDASPVSPVKSGSGSLGTRSAAASPEGGTGDPRRCVSRNPLSEKCMNLLLVLLYNRKQNERVNPFRDVFCMLFNESGFDEDDPKEGVEMVPLFNNQQHPGAGDSAMGVDFQGLAVSLAETLPSESSSLLLYALLNMHPGFLDYLITSKHIEPVLCAVLKGLYASSTATCVDHLYVLIVNVLVMVQDKLLRQALSTMKVRAPWYTEHSLTSFSLADLTMLCTLRCTLYALFKLKDQYLLSNCFAVMLDLAPFLKNMDCYVSERLTKVIYQLAKRCRRSAAGTANGKADRHTGEYSPSKESSPLIHCSDNPLDSAAEQNAQETLLVLLKACSLALRPSRRSLNVHLLYALMHEHEKLKEVLPIADVPGDSAAHDQKGAALDALAVPREILAMTGHYLDKLKLQETAFISAVEAVNSLRSVIEVEMQTVKHQEETRGLNFSYAEESNADSFFVPCVWASTIRAAPDIGFALNLIRLFDPTEKRLV